MKPYIGKKSRGAVCRYGCCFVTAKCQPHYRKPNAHEKKLSRRIARARGRSEVNKRTNESFQALQEGAILP
jgi:hypothetical protein